jgi:hypothetical protein
VNEPSPPAAADVDAGIGGITALDVVGCGVGDEATEVDGVAVITVLFETPFFGELTAAAMAPITISAPMIAAGMIKALRLYHSGCGGGNGVAGNGEVAKPPGAAGGGGR